MKFEEIMGWFEGDNQEPSHDPTINAKCVVCNTPLINADRKTISLMYEGDTNSYFYRVHKGCYSHPDMDEIEGTLLDMIHDKPKNKPK